MIVERPSCSATLALRVLQQSTSIVLFVALWSYESFLVSNTFSKIARELNCSSSVAFLEYDTPIAEVHRTRSRDPLLSLPWLRHKRSDLGHVAYNITKGLPWFPALRVFEAEGGRILGGSTYQGSFSPSEMRIFLAQYCGNSQNAIWQSSHSALPSELSEMVYLRSPAAAKGVLIFAGDETVSVRGVWEAAAEQLHLSRDVSSGPGREDSSGKNYREWLVAVFNKTEYKALAERYDINRDSNSSSVVLLDAFLDKVEVHRDARLSVVAEAMTALKNFEEQGQGIWQDIGKQGREKRELDESVPVGVPGWLSECANVGNLRPVRCGYKPELCSQRNSPVMSRFSELKPNTTIWVVFFEPWCAYSQRVLPSFTSFAERAVREKIDARVYAMSNISQLPSAIDYLVDGFPTVLVLRGDDRTGPVREYTGSYAVDDLLRYSRSLAI